MIAWVLNLDAEDELALGGFAHTPAPRTVERIRSLLPRLEALVSTSRILFPHRLGDERHGEGPLTGYAWSPTRYALKIMAESGVTPAPHAPMPVLCRVNHRRFNAQLGQTLEGAHYVDSLSSLPPGAWLLKRPYGYAGRGRRKVTDALTPADRAFIAASTDGLQVEPWVDRILDCAIHGWLNADGTCHLGHPTLQTVDDTGAWQSTERTNVLTHNESAALHNEAVRAAKALHAEGYFGPFNLDAYRWRDADGHERFQPRSEINARFSMGWAIGMGDFRLPLLDAQRPR